MKTINLYFRTGPKQDRFVKGDRHFIRLVKKLVRQKRVSSLEKVFTSLGRGFDELGIAYKVNRPFNKIGKDEPVVVLGSGRYALQGYAQPNPVIAGIGLMTHPGEWPDLFNEYPVARYLQHSAWANDIYAAYYGKENCEIWPVGIDTDRWSPDQKAEKQADFLIYNKIMWDKEETGSNLRAPLLNKLNQLGFTHKEIIYGSYTEAEYFGLLQQSRAMIFLCEHESQGFACCEALSMDVPVFAWDQGYWLDPNRFKWGAPVVKATSIPYFDGRCGDSFKDYAGFESKIEGFFQNVKQHKYNPRAYILENLTLKKSAERMLEIINEVYSS